MPGNPNDAKPAPSVPKISQAERHRLYTLAINTLDRLTDDLNDSAETCPNCHLQTYTDRKAFLERRSLKKAIDRLTELRTGKVEYP